MTRWKAIVSAVLLAAAGGTLGFVRETTTPGHPTTGLCLYWGSRTVPYKVNAASAASPPGGRAACPQCAPCQDGTGAAAVAAVTAALPAWGQATQAGGSQACTDLSLQSAGTSTQTAIGNDGTNLVVFRTGWCGNASIVPLSDPCRATVGACAAKYNCWEHDASGTVALTTLTFETSTGRILDADVEFHGWDGNNPPNGAYLTCAASPGCSSAPWQTGEQNCAYMDVQSVALHEAGHVLGLDHTCVYPAPNDACPAGSVMQPNLPTGTTRRTLAADDVSGVCTIYPRGGPTLTCGGGGGGGGGTSSGSGGCSTGGGAGVLAIGAALLALLRTRRRGA